MQEDAKPQLTVKQRRFLSAMLTARTVADAARQAGIAERTAYLYLSTPHFQAALDHAVDETLSHTAHQATAAMDRAIAALCAILDDPASPLAARIAAARTILQVGPRLHEAVTLTQRVTTLENQPKDSDLWI
jgi:phage terminase small subunit